MLNDEQLKLISAGSAFNDKTEDKAERAAIKQLMKLKGYTHKQAELRYDAANETAADS